MPRKPLLANELKPADLDLAQIEHLINGYCLISEEGYPFESEQDRKQCWLKHRDRVMGLIGKAIEDVEWPTLRFPWGARPHAWWDYEAPEPRRIIKPGAEGIEAGDELSFGVPKGYDIDDPEDVKELPIYESQSAYLKRLNLFLPGEEEALEQQRMQ